MLGKVTQATLSVKANHFSDFIERETHFTVLRYKVTVTQKPINTMQGLTVSLVHRNAL